MKKKNIRNWKFVTCLLLLSLTLYQIFGFLLFEASDHQTNEMPRFVVDFDQFETENDETTIINPEWINISGFDWIVRNFNFDF
jgi:hypothetical protein